MAGRLRDPNPTTSSVSWTMPSHDDGAITVSQEEATSPALSYCLPSLQVLHIIPASDGVAQPVGIHRTERRSGGTVAAPLH